jgi:FKBP-type peptidyl-prolyl cis-trans isomerase 2
MQKAKQGDTVRVHYRGTLEDGSVFDSSADGDPIEFTIGEGEVIPGFEDAVVGMAVGEKKEQRILPEQAYGDREEELMFEVDRSTLPADAELTVGDLLQLTFPNGETAPVKVAAVSDKSVQLDANHPLTGKTLIFELELVEIGEAAAQSARG